MQIPLTFEVSYLGKANQEVTRSKEKYIFRIILVAAKKAINREWLKTDAPKMEDWVEVMLNIYRIEKLTFSTRLKHRLLKNYWENWDNFLSPLRAVFVQ